MHLYFREKKLSYASSKFPFSFKKPLFVSNKKLHWRQRQEERNWNLSNQRNTIIIWQKNMPAFLKMVKIILHVRHLQNSEKILYSMNEIPIFTIIENRKKNNYSTLIPIIHKKRWEEYCMCYIVRLMIKKERKRELKIKLLGHTNQQLKIKN